ncbi:retrovirus-related Pol polyprotein from transposon 17.6 [Trichonephila clavipes]|nr:retrovirus-related Pol polyprotein from transposon 17.6 [Trichonephila clavipes]
MSFGLSTCPSTFMQYINAIFRHLISKSIVLPYMDDIVIPAANESQALEYLKIVLQVACDYGLEINFKKCQFLHNTIEFLGHIIENGRLFPSPSKTKAVINYPDLKNIKDVRRFLGLTGYFRKFLPSYLTIAKPLSDLLRKDSLFQFYAKQQTAFQKLKYLLSQQPVLSIFGQNSPTEIHTDASIDGLGAVLLQKNPYMTTSFTLYSTCQKRHQTMKERSTDAAESHINRLENQRHVFGKTPLGLSLIKRIRILLPPHLKITVKNKTSFISPLQLVSQDLMAKFKNKNSTIIAVLLKLSVDDPEKWYSHVPHLQEILNSTFQRSIKMTPFELLFGIKMKSYARNIEIVELLNDEITAQFKNNVMLSVRCQKANLQKFKMRIAARTISGADKLININYMT